MTCAAIVLQLILATRTTAPEFIETTHSLQVDGRERTYVVQAPANPTGLLPVVFFFHGGSGSGEGIAAKGFREMTAKENFIAVYPSGWKNNWNDGRNAARIVSQQEGVDDVKFVRAVVADLEKRHSFDRSRIFATGVSNGGIFSHYLAAKASDLFTGIAPVIGGLAEPVAGSFRPSHPISLMVIQGDEDPLVPINGGAIANNDRGGRVISTDDMLKLYLKLNSVSGAPLKSEIPNTDPEDGCRTFVSRYPPSKMGAKVEYWLVQGGGHTMPGGRQMATSPRESRVGRTCRDFDGLQAIWDFFKSCPPRTVTSGPVRGLRSLDPLHFRISPSYNERRSSFDEATLFYGGGRGR
jgi:polyhydroxybutyrate depolymerase